MQQSYADRAFNIFNNYQRQRRSFKKEDTNYYAFLFYLINSLEDINENKKEANIVRGYLVHLYFEVQSTDVYKFFVEGGLHNISATTLYSRAASAGVTSHSSAYLKRFEDIYYSTYANTPSNMPKPSDSERKEAYRTVYLLEILDYSQKFQTLVESKGRNITDEDYAALLCYLGYLGEASLQLRADKSFNYDRLKQHFKKYGYENRIYSLGRDRNYIFHNQRANLPNKTQLLEEIYVMAVMQKFVEEELQMTPSSSYIEREQETKKIAREAAVISSTTITSQVLTEKKPILQLTEEEKIKEQELTEQAIKELIAETTAVNPKPKVREKKPIWVPVVSESEPSQKNVISTSTKRTAESTSSRLSAQPSHSPFWISDKKPRKESAEKEKKEKKRSKSPPPPPS